MFPPIPDSVLKRRPGFTTHYRSLFGTYWGPCNNDPQHKYYAGCTVLYEIKKLRLGNAVYDVYWIYHNARTGGELPLYDKWRVFDECPRWLKLNAKNKAPWIKMTTAYQDWQASMRLAQEHIDELVKQKPMIKRTVS